MQISDTIRSEGHVEPYLLDIKTGERTPIGGRHNTLSFDAAHAMALAFGGDESLIPNRIGIIYGREDNTQFLSIGRDQPWNDLKTELTELNADVQIKPFCYAPSFKRISRSSSGYSSSETGYGQLISDGSGSGSPGSSSGSVEYPGWSVTFHSHSDSVTPGLIASESGTSAPGGDSIFTTGAMMYQAVLLNKTRDVYTVIARASLEVNSESGKYYAKPENFEIALDWTVKFF